jgi:hypothetical protein
MASFGKLSNEARICLMLSGREGIEAAPTMLKPPYATGRNQMKKKSGPIILRICWTKRE